MGLCRLQTEAVIPCLEDIVMSRLFVSTDNIIQYVYTKQRDEIDIGT
jgi:hypothetical protein